MAKTTRNALAGTIALGLALVVCLPALGATPKTKRVSVRSNGTEAVGGESYRPSISGSGRLVAFQSDATNLVPGDENDSSDIFVHDRKTQKTKRVSVRSNGNEGDGVSSDPAISSNGRWVAFGSDATNLVGGDTNNRSDIFVHDRKTQKTRRMSVRSNGAQGDASAQWPSISANGRWIAFESSATNLIGGDTNGYGDIFVHDRKTEKTKRVSLRSNGDEADEGSREASISADGRFVAFQSEATDLVGGDNNGYDDTFVHDRKTKKTRRVSLRSNGNEGNEVSHHPSISASGRFVAFESRATNLVGGDTNGDGDMFVHDRKTRKTKRVSVRSNGDEADFGTDSDPSISASGRYIAFQCYATNLVGGDTNDQPDVFVHDRKTKRTRRVSVRFNGAQANDSSFEPSISADGRVVAFDSSATNLVAGDDNGQHDVFVRGPLP